jgi:hypothetical protein
MPSLGAPTLMSNEREFCDLERDVSEGVACNPNYKYRRIDGKCNNLKETNWGSTFHCQRRLLPPDYNDGVNGERMARDGSPLPNERLISDFFADGNVVLDKTRSSMHMEWGQVVAHDSVKTLQYFGGNLDPFCCPPPSPHPECGLYTPVPPDMVLTSYNQTCLVTSRSTACNTCRLGYDV